eukprot:344817-Amphidinium_carterae.1
MAILMISVSTLRGGGSGTHLTCATRCTPNCTQTGERTAEQNRPLKNPEKVVAIEDWPQHNHSRMQTLLADFAFNSSY